MKLNRKRKNLIFIFCIVLILVVIVINTSYAYQNELDEQMQVIVANYYETKVKGTNNLDEQIIPLDALFLAGYDMEVFREANCDFESSYAYIIKDKDNYIIESHLKCEERLP